MGSRLGGEGRSPHHEIGVMGLPAEGTAGCKLLCTHAGLPAPQSRPDLHEHGREAEQSSQLLVEVWKFGDSLKKRAEVESFAGRLVLAVSLHQPQPMLPFSGQPAAGAWQRGNGEGWPRFEGVNQQGSSPERAQLH